MNLAAQWKKKTGEWASPGGPLTTESASKRTQRPSGSIFTVWHGSLPTACYRRGRVTVTAKESLWNSPRMQTWIFLVQFSGSDVSSDGAHRPDHICRWAERRDQIKRPFFFLGNLNDVFGDLTAAFDLLGFAGPFFRPNQPRSRTGSRLNTFMLLQLVAQHSRKHPNKDEESIKNRAPTWKSMPA